MLLLLGAVVEERCVFEVIIDDEGVVLSDALVGLAVVEVVVVGVGVRLFEGEIVVGVVGAIVLLHVEGVVRYLLQHVGLSVYILVHLLYLLLDVSLKSCKGLFPSYIY